MAFAHARAHGADRWIDWPGVGVFAFTTGSPVVSVAAARALDEVRDLFARVLQPVVLQALGCQALHASAVWGPGGVVAFCGRGRSGKSTLAYALARHGFQQIADDALLIDSIGDEVTVRPLPFEPQLREPSRHFFDRTPTEPASPAPSGRTCPAFASLRGVFVLNQDAAVARVPAASPLPPVRGFAALLQHAHCFDQRPLFHAEAIVKDYLRIVERVPVFSLSYAPTFAGLDGLVHAVVAAAATIGVRPMPLVLEM